MRWWVSEWVGVSRWSERRRSPSVNAQSSPRKRDLMHVRRGLVAAITAALLLVAAAPSYGAAKHYANCTALNKAYPHGVGRPGAHDRSSGTPVSSFTVSSALYNANSSSDRDGDGVACEKR